MKWYYKIANGHVHVRVFMNGAKCGDLCFRVDEFEQVRREKNAIATIKFISESENSARLDAIEKGLKTVAESSALRAKS